MDLSSPIAGFVAGTMGVVVSHPFDTVKTRIQAGWQGSGGVLHLTLQQQGFRGLYRGVLPPLLHSGLIQALSFTLYQRGKDRLGLSPFFAGMFSGGLCAIVLLPGYFVKVQLQNERGRTGTSTVEFCSALVRRHGLWPVFRAMYGRAFPISFASDSIGRACYLGTFESVKRRLSPSDAGAVPLAARIAAASCSGIASWTSMYPLDTIRSCLMAGPIVGNPVGARDVIRSLYSEGGLRAFYRGYHVTIMRAVPVAIFVLTSYDLVHDALRAPPTRTFLWTPAPAPAPSLPAPLTV